MTAIAFILFMSSGITGPISSLYTASLGASYVAIGFLGTVTSLTRILSSYVWGRASDHLEQRRAFLVLSLAALAVCYGLTTVVPSYEYLFPLRVLGAVAHAAYSVASLALMGDLLERRAEERGRRMGTWRGLSSLGFGLMAFASGSVADRLSIRAPYGLAALFLVIAFSLSLRIRERSSGSVHGGRFTLRGGLRRERSAERFAFLRSLLLSAWEGARRGVDRLVTSAGQKAGSGPKAVSESLVGENERLPLSPLLLSVFLWSLVTGAVYAVWANYMVSELGYTPAAMSRLWALASTSEFPLMILLAVRSNWTAADPQSGVPGLGAGLCGVRVRARDALDRLYPAHPGLCLFCLYRHGDDLRDRGPIQVAAWRGLRALQFGRGHRFHPRLLDGGYPCPACRLSDNDRHQRRADLWRGRLSGRGGRSPRDAL